MTRESREQMQAAGEAKIKRVRLARRAATPVGCDGAMGGKKISRFLKRKKPVTAAVPSLGLA